MDGLRILDRALHNRALLVALGVQCTSRVRRSNSRPQQRLLIELIRRVIREEVRAAVEF